MLSEISSVVVSVLNKEKDKERRKLNVIVHGIPEANLKNHWKGKHMILNRLILKHLEVDVAVDNTIRLGKKDKDKCHILRISLLNESLKKQLCRVPENCEMTLTRTG